jgi:acyl dehydratase
MLVFAVASGLGVYCPPVRTLAFLGVREWHFRGPVYPGDTIRIRGRVIEKTIRGRGRRGEIVWQRQILNQDERVVQEGILITLVEARGGSSNSEAPSDENSDDRREPSAT